MAASMEVQENNVLKVLELYSGIGGMHYALQASGIAAVTVGAVDINDLANKVYRHNFPQTNLMQRSIEGITQAEFTKLDADMLLMSPPCQPFTRQGLKGDSQDARTKSFFYVMDMLQRLPKTPCYILVENVKGFETSHTRNYLIETLEKCNYTYEEFLLSPVHLGIPNQRLRYFLLAKKRPLQFASTFSLAPNHILQTYHINSNGEQKLKHDISEDAFSKRLLETESSKCENSSHRTEHVSTDCGDTSHCSSALRNSNEQHNEEDGEKTCRESLHIDAVRPEIDGLECASASIESRTCSSFVLNSTIKDYLQELDDDDITKYALPDKVLVRYGRLMDIVTSSDERTMCFTKGYGHKAEGTGSVLQSNTTAKRAEAFSSLAQESKTEPAPEVVEKLRNLKLRYFTPREIARLHHLPEEFNFPADVTVKQCYRVLGNSLNAYVVSVLIQYLVAQ
ncbi:tRNA (cytosine(38)-C(5))-methyltransferase-like [Amphiura filiformis]|uniref:tRNA (cytosine(38)-C(5))-methyltransferase-like n=1 Tax=Amphiura filiformis TaxID=82378 RepID=UPI003B21FC2B